MGEKLSPIFCLDKFVFFRAIARYSEARIFTRLVALLGYYLIYINYENISLQKSRAVGKCQQPHQVLYTITV